jgi:hypothetical protein
VDDQTGGTKEISQTGVCSVSKVRMMAGRWPDGGREMAIAMVCTGYRFKG